MAERRTDRRGSLLAQVHIGCKDLGLTEEDYRAILARVAGHVSARDCAERALEAVLGEYRRLGWKPAGRGTDWRRPAAHAHQRKVFALWGEAKRRGIWRDRGRASIHSFAKRITGIEQVEWLGPKDAAKVIQALEAMIAEAPAGAARAQPVRRRGGGRDA